MERFGHSRMIVVLVYVLLSLLILFMLIQVSPFLIGVYTFLKAIFAPFIIAMIISYVLNPIVNILHERKVPRTVAVLLIYAVFVTSVIVVLMNFIPMFMKQLRELNEHLPEISMKAQHFLDGFNNNKFLPESIREGVQQSLAHFESAISLAITRLVQQLANTLSAIFVAIIIPFLAFYMLKDFQLIEKTLITILPKKHRQQWIRLLMDIDRALGNYIRGQLMVCVIVGVFAYLGYIMIDLPYPLLLASVVAVFNIIPYLGPFFGAAPAILMASTISLKMVLLVIGVNFLVQVLEGNVISPQIVGKKLHMHPLFIIFALLVGGQIAGVAGLILAVPFFAVLKVIAQHVFEYYIQGKELSRSK